MAFKTKEEKLAYHREYNRPYMKEHRKKNIEAYKENYKRRRTLDRAGGLLICTRQSAKKKGLEHTITREHISQVEFCPLTGIKIDWTVSGRHLSNPSVDRIDSTKGYTPDNIEIMSCLGNTMKNKATVEQLLFFARAILKRYG